MTVLKYERSATYQKYFVNIFICHHITCNLCILGISLLRLARHELYGLISKTSDFVPEPNCGKAIEVIMNLKYCWKTNLFEKGSVR